MTFASFVPDLGAVSLDGLVVLAAAIGLLWVQVSDRGANAMNAAVGAVTSRVPGASRVGDRFASGHLRMIGNLWKYLLVLGVVVVVSGVDPAWLNLDDVRPATALVGGVALGCVGYAVGELGGVVLFDGLGFEYETSQRAAMAPEGSRAWVEFLAVGLVVVSAWEELAFRGVLVGVAAGALSVSPWVTAVVSVCYFGYVHRYMGTGAVLVTTLMGGVLTVAFVLGASLPLLVVAHTVANALEFLVHETAVGEPLPTHRFGFGG